MSIIHTIFINVKREYRRAILPKYSVFNYRVLTAF